MFTLAKYMLFIAELMLVLLSLMAGFGSSLTDNFTDQSALLAIRDQITFDPNKTITNNWTIETSFCNWIGVSCSKSKQRVTSLNLSYMGLEGILAPHIYNLSFLMLLDLRNNSFTGKLQDEVGFLRRLRILDLGNNKFIRDLPSGLGNLQNLSSLSLSGNNFNGTIPSSIGNTTKLEVLDLGDNQLRGTIPKELGDLLNLQELVIRKNDFMGAIPTNIFNITSLRIIEFSDNSFFGNLQEDAFQSLTKLKVLVLDDNELSSQIPSSLWKCRELRRVSLVDNKFTGSISSEIGNLSKLQALRLTGNNITGSIPASLGNISTLTFIAMGRNSIGGNLPEELGQLKNLQLLNIELNSLTGKIPQGIFNISSLRALSLTLNRLEGEIPSSGGRMLPILEILFLSNNRLRGEIPASISNSSRLTRIDLSGNLLTGSIPASLGNLQFLQILNLIGNQLTNEVPNGELHFYTALTNCRYLERLQVGYNPLNGFFPNSIGNLSTNLQWFMATRSQFKGEIPIGIGNLSGLITIALEDNDLSGAIPSTLGGLKNLQRLYVNGNELQGSIPSELCSLSQLGELGFHENKLTGSIPNCISNLSRLQRLYLQSNKLSAPIPFGLFSLQNLLVLNLSSNTLIGSIPSEVGKLFTVEDLDLSRNQLSGNISSSIGDLQSIRNLTLSRNSFQGPIPESFGKLTSLESLDLSYNNLSGVVPSSLEALVNLNHLNLSFNRLQGEIPKGGPFQKFPIQSFTGNEALCSGAPKLQLPACPRDTPTKSRKAFLVLYILLIIIGALVIIVALLFIYLRYRTKKWQVPVPADSPPETITHRMISYQELVQATDNFSEANLLGGGGSGSVYKGTLSDGKITAIKVLDLQLEGAFKNFDAECRVLRSVRHRNLVTVITACSNLQFKALVFEYMPNGSLEKWLYSHNYYLNLLQRVNISLDVAFALEYLHHGHSEPIVHCDIKPSNVLLDKDMVAHVADFGIAKILAENRSTAETKTLGTLGYIAPEYGLEGRVSSCGDVYSYGIMLLEIFTRKRPTDEMFVGEMSLREWVLASFPNAVDKIVDANLLKGAKDGYLIAVRQQNCLTSIIELALECSNQSPEERVNMEEVVVRLNKIKFELVSDARSSQGKK